MSSATATFRAPPTLAFGIDDLASKRREHRHPTLPYRMIVTGRSFRYPLGCSLRNRSSRGALIEFEPAHADDPVAILQSKTFIWIFFCTEGIWQEAMVRWRNNRQFGVSFMGDPLPSAPLSWAKDPAHTYRYRQVMAMAGRPLPDPQGGR